MIINKLCLQNFRKFKELCITLHPGVNLLIGDNASGKTSLIESLKIAAGSYFYSVNSDHASAPSIEKNVDVRFQQSPSGLFDYHFPVQIIAEGCIGSNAYTWSRELRTAKGRTTKEGLKDLVDGIRTSDSELRPVIAYYSTARLQSERKETQPYKKDDRYEAYFNALESSSNVRRFISWFENEDRIAYQEGAPTLGMKVVSSAINNCLPHSKCEISYSARLTQIVVKDENGVITPYIHMSDGYQLITSMIGDLAYRCAILNPQLGVSCLADAEGVVLIDEIEMHLHPSWQLKIIDALERTFPKIQFIISTHSPIILSGASNAHVIRLNANDTNIDNQQIHTSGRKLEHILYQEQNVNPRKPETQATIDQFYRYLKNRDTLEQAEQILHSFFIDQFGETDPETVAARRDYEFAVEEFNSDF